MLMMNPKLPPLIETPPGRYRHYKGMLYDVIGTARHSESLEPMTLYRAMYGDEGLWVRPAAMFNEEVVFNGTRQRRFTLIAEAADLGSASRLPQPADRHDEVG